MNEQTLEMLAAKLGVGVEVLWGALLRQAPIAGMVDLAIIAALPWLFYVAIKAVRNGIANDTGNEYESFWQPFMGFAACIALVATTLLAVSNFSVTIAAFYNPEYWALHEIMHAIRRK